MKLTQLAAKPQLIRIELNDDEVIKEYGEPLEFWIYDRQPMAQFIKLAQMKQEDFSDLVDAVNSMVLDEDGSPVVKDDLILPTTIMGKVVTKVVETLGK
tara:strand:- start:639 stop:935 length:297 start_codon:yes stop_codon:yes gene_type:complete